MNDFNFLKASIIASTLVVLSVFTLHVHADEPMPQEPLAASVLTPPLQHRPWPHQLWQDVLALRERLFGVLPEPANYVELHPVPDSGNAFENSLVFQPEHGADQPM